MPLCKSGFQYAMVTKGRNSERPINGLGQKGNERALSVTHPPVDAPLCPECRQFDLAFFDSRCRGCLEMIKSPTTTAAEIFAVLRQWVPRTQRNIEIFANLIIQRGAYLDDRDGLTDMTLLHYACKAGAKGVGDVDCALRVVEMLIDNGANVFLRCKWTKMNALHYAAFFDVALVVKLLLERCKGLDVNSPCPNYDNGTALHICAMNLCLDAAHVLLAMGADLLAKDELSRIPFECIPDKSTFKLVPDINERIDRMKTLLSPKENAVVEESGKKSLSGISGKAVLKGMNFSLNERVVVGDCKAGYLRYCGSTEFAPGIWAGVELDDCEGKNNGSVNGVVYFKCSSNHGIFLPVDRVSKANDVPCEKMPVSCKGSHKQTVNLGKVDISRVTSKVSTGLNLGSQLKDVKFDDQVVIRRTGASGEIEDHCGWVRYIGTTDFTSGIWIGVELKKETDGRHDGSIGGKRYFSCPPRRGILIPISRLKRFSGKVHPLSDAIDTAMSKEENHGEIMWEASCISLKKDLHAGTKSMPSYAQGSRQKNLLRSFSVGYTLTGSPFSSQRQSCRSNILKRSQSCEGRGPSVAIGMNALYNHKIGIVKYVGPVEFAEGCWLGLELRESKGKHDGLVNGKRYFTSKPGHGIMVQCKNVTIRGINCEKLICT